MDGRTLPWRWLGRAVKPLTLCVLIATGASAWSETTNSAGVYNETDPLGWITQVQADDILDPEIPEVKPLPETKATKG